MRRVAVALLHYPVLDRERGEITTAITNLDIHDIARSAHTYGLAPYYLVHPVAAQRELALRVREHWTTGGGARRIPDRAAPLGGVEVVPTLEDCIAHLGGGARVERWTTSAAASPAPVLSFARAGELLRGQGPPVLILFGTGWGLADSVHAASDYQLARIESPREDGYNHLSVRAAAAITFDRLVASRAAARLDSAG